MNSRHAVFVIDPPERLDPPTDTSLALMRELVGRDWQVHWTSLDGLCLRDGNPWAMTRPVRFPDAAELFGPSEPEEFDLSRAEMLFMRKDPPVDLAYLHAALILDRLPPRVLQINPAKTLHLHCEKLIPALFPALAPASLVSSDTHRLEDFLREQQHIVIKPLEDCSGHGVHELRRGDSNARPLLASLTQEGRRFLQAQRFLPEIQDGDKRVLLLDGEILGWVRRVPAPGDFRSNVNAGGRCLPCDLSENDRRICAMLSPWLRREGILLAGIDIVGDKVLEVNITSPSCLREINQLTGQRLETRIIDVLETRAGQGRT
ncbi:glutathione synthase [Geoalkalibacter sp.]|uniref:glutathione synthase n=1 Tax=Geoalkalibacter sp. TaxID=3041440 RepID=UPI00272E63D4|nr:glutathione synthase [Geoalkalibacter sp.]